MTKNSLNTLSSSSPVGNGNRVAPKVPIHLAIVGIGGFAQYHHLAIQQMEKQGLARLVATCDPEVDRLEGILRELNFESRGVSLEDDLDSILERHGSRLHAVTLPVPIHLHSPMHAACVDRGLDCYLEKPPTLNPQELRRMIAKEACARPTFVGFHHLANNQLHDLKARIVAGEFGRLLDVSFLGLAQRPPAYYQRNAWAGRLTFNDHILLDSPCGNAMSHHLMNLLYLAGTRHQSEFAKPSKVESILARANAIQGADTVFAAFELENGITGRMALTHACRNACVQREILTFDQATIVINPRQQMEIHPRTGPSQKTPFMIPHVSASLEQFVRYVDGHSTSPPARLKDCTGFVDLNALLYIAAPQIHTIGISSTERDDATGAPVIRNIDTAAKAFVMSKQWPSDEIMGIETSIGSAGRNELDQLPEALDRLSRGITLSASPC